MTDFTPGELLAAAATLDATADRQGHIPEPRIGSLFTGYGGLDMAAETVFDATTEWVADIDPGPRKILAHRYPDAPNLGDVTAIDWAAVPPVDIITGGSPCQDLSTAGKRAGMTAGTRSNLWVAMREAIAALQPKLVIWENVRGALSAAAHSAMEPCPGCMGDDRPGPVLRALGRVLGDLAELGYDARWCGLRAADVGAPHGRFRVFLLATRGNAADADQQGLEGQQDQTRAAQAGRHGHALAGAGGLDLTLLPTPTSNLGSNGGPQDPDKRRAGGHSVSIEDAVHGLQLLPTPDANLGNGGRTRSPEALAKGDHQVNLNDIVRLDWGRYAAAIARWETIHGPAPAPTMTSPRTGNQQLSPAFTEWMMGLPAGWVTDTPGITRNEALKLCGNGVVPQQATAALRHLAGMANAMHLEGVA